MKKPQAFLFSLLLTSLIVLNIHLINSITAKQKTIIISRVIDGDTFVSTTNETFRLLNINTPEKGKPFYEEAKQFLKEFENQTLKIQTTSQDKYQRTLARIYSEKYLNLELVKQGLAVKYLVDSSEAKLFSNAEAEAIENQKGQWTKSSYFNELKIKLNKEKEFIIIETKNNSINITNWKIKDESRKEYTFPETTLSKINLHSRQGKDNETDLFWNSNQNIWNNDKDTIYIFDSNWGLVYYETYGY